MARELHGELAAQLYTAKGKHATTVSLDQVFGKVAYWNPEQSEYITIGKDCGLAGKKRGWIMTDLLIQDLKNSEPSWSHKLTMMNGDAEKVVLALAVWK